MAKWSYNINVKNVEFDDFNIFMKLLKIEQVENLIQTTLSIIYRNVPPGRRLYSQWI